MSALKAYVLSFSLFATSGLLAQSAMAQKVNGCPPGQAIQSSDPSGFALTCIAIPDGAALRGQIAAEVAARLAGDAQLNQAINDEAAARQRAVDALGGDGITEASIVGTYTFSGPAECISSSNGFNPDFSPKAPEPGGPSTFVQMQSILSSGTRTFNAGGRGTIDVYTQSVTGPAVFYAATIFAPPGFPPTVSAVAGVGTAGAPLASGAPRPSGGAGASRTTGDFTWHIADGKLFIEEDAAGASGPIVEGGSAGSFIRVVGLPKSVGVVGKDGKVISLMQESVQVETSTTTLANGTERSTDRICLRERLLRKL
jgi:hypothetical protein